MRELKLTEISTIAGGVDTNGYNFSNIVASSLWVGCIGSLLFGANPLHAAAAGGFYASAMMAAKLGDHYFELEDKPKPIITSTIINYPGES